MLAVKLFLSDDCPSKVGQKSQENLQAKTLTMLPSSTNEYNDLPPGFEGNYFLIQSKAKFSHIPQIKWECAPQFTPDPEWRLAAGEHSREKVDQKHREMRVLEAVYPRLSAIPPSPSVSSEVEQEDYDDNLTPLIPITEPVEEEDSVDITPEMALTQPFDTTTNLQSQNFQQSTSATSPIIQQCHASSTVPSSACGGSLPGISPGLEQDLTAAVIAAISRSNDQGNLIDMDLLAKIFNDPILIEKLIKERGRTAAATPVNASSNSVSIPTSGLEPATSVPVSKPTTPPSTMALPSMSNQATKSASFLTPAPGKPADPSVSIFTSALHNPVGKSASPSLTLPRPLPPSPPAPAPLNHKHVNTNNHHMTDGVLHNLNTHPPQQDLLVSYGPRRSESLGTLLPFPSTTMNAHAGANQVGSTASSAAYQPSISSAFAVKKDANYYKNLIKQHGADKKDKQDSQIGTHHNNFEDSKTVQNFKMGEMISKIQKPCIYFKSPRGCRNGFNCPYQHDMSVQLRVSNVLESPNQKRFKLGPEINWRV
ncbi:hypothetical protein TanjilG_22029 [Lupinus angustifolius]|uniref:C3H1-type domain-containing protein n=1 Tax=Lupinus angustifolius TaxID=3871 RepID=A0A4P1QTL5_LUPAN|nr:hypothetical protein TanjilG_22029 [Lupinus angustifolius]